MKEKNYSWLICCFVFIAAILLAGCPNPPDVPKPSEDDEIFKVTISSTLPDQFGNTVTASPMQGISGTTVNVQVQAAEGYQLKSGTLKYNGTDVPANLSFTLTSDVEITAEFELILIWEVIDDIVWNKTANSLTIKWDTVEGAAKYEILHGLSRFSEYFPIDIVNENSSGNSYTHTTINPNKYENYYKIIALDGSDTEISVMLVSLEMSMFGPTVYFYSPHDEMAAIQKEINDIHGNSRDDSNGISFGSLPQGNGFNGEFSSRRFAFFFKPGEYHFDVFNDFDGYWESLKIGFNTSIAGLGRLPTDTVIYGTVATPAHLANNNNTCTFWRSIENLSIQNNPNYSRANIFNWGVSQAAPMRRMHTQGVVTEFLYRGGYGSGGFSADCSFGGSISAGGQQQWYVRNSHFGASYGGVIWNKNVQGVTHDVSAESIIGSGQLSNGTGTWTDETPVIREKPFLFIDDDGEYKVFLPAVRNDSKGISWGSGKANEGMGEGTIIDVLENFYIARAELIFPDGHVKGISRSLDNAARINYQISSGKHIFITPGVMELESPIFVNRADTIVLGYGYPSLQPRNPNGAMFLSDLPGITIASLMFEATGSNTPYILCAGETGANSNHSSNPTLLADIVVRVGGFLAEEVHADISVLVNSNNVIGDHFWIWRADHGQGSGDFRKWDKHTSKNGVVVFGDDVTMYGYFIEHHHEYLSLWMGERGRTYFFQNEPPYDPPHNDYYVSRRGMPEEEGVGETRGWAQYKVDNRVNEHLARGLGMYPCYNQNQWNLPGRMITLWNPVEVPHKPDVKIYNAVTVNLIPASGVSENIINSIGNRNTSTSTQTVTSFVDGVGSGSREGKEPADEVHWVESLVISSSGTVTANPDGGKHTIRSPDNPWED